MKRHSKYQIILRNLPSTVGFERGKIFLSFSFFENFERNIKDKKIFIMDLLKLSTKRTLFDFQSLKQIESRFMNKY